jgi:hypothetical protein
VKPIDGADPLVCTRPRGHDGRHATLNAVGEAIAEWPTPWTADDERARQARQAWHKPHVRREYVTLATWVPPAS